MKTLRLYSESLAAMEEHSYNLCFRDAGPSIYTYTGGLVSLMPPNVRHNAYGGEIFVSSV